MHQNNLRDYASGGLYSSEMQNRGTIMHESGHGLFDLADEYGGGSHFQTDPYPNNWPSLAAAQAAGSQPAGKTTDHQNEREIVRTQLIHTDAKPRHLVSEAHKSRQRIERVDEL